MTNFSDTDQRSERLRGVLERQHGRISWAQLRRCGFAPSTLYAWIRQRRLIKVLPKVYAYGYAATTQEARFWAAILYAGPGAMLSHLTAAQHRGLIKYAPPSIHVSTVHKVANRAGIVVHRRRRVPGRVLERVDHVGIPVTTAEQTLLDLAAIRPDLLRRALGQLDFLGMWDQEALHACVVTHAPGARALRAAIDAYDPAFAHLNGDFEQTFYERCLEWGIEPLPLPNVEIVPGHLVDAFWPEHQLIVELDGGSAHQSPAQPLHDAERDRVTRGLGHDTIRYRRAQLDRRPAAIRADLSEQLARRATGARRTADTL